MPIGGGAEVKQTNEIGMVIPVVEDLNIAGRTSTKTIYGLTSHTPQTEDAAPVLAFNRGQWAIENGCHSILG